MEWSHQQMLFSWCLIHLVSLLRKTLGVSLTMMVPHCHGNQEPGPRNDVRWNGDSLAWLGWFMRDWLHRHKLFRWCLIHLVSILRMTLGVSLTIMVPVYDPMVSKNLTWPNKRNMKCWFIHVTVLFTRIMDIKTCWLEINKRLNKTY